ncbi:MAG: 3'-_5' ssDNA/RNA exonuclease TatD [Thermodesulfobacterium sp.]|uniref:3'->5' ssDNA/RNA exonuclease TatD n=1 Tax=Candidatus Thermodesulfobacterium syntrophicum TaxID=3060442 RepID=A0AAE3P6B9_9BACT|nr:3'->5' ssDNA/RNA exonuclease TatD [Candidatus Thermodesulfobacterium syntrophicum]
MRFIDTHAHLNFPEFKKDLENVIKRAKENLVCQVVVVGINVNTNKKALELAELYPEFIKPAIGFHPHETKKIGEGDYKFLEENINKVCAIGEIGLDWVKEYSPKEVQIEHFIRQLELAKKYSKPVILHLRGEDSFWNEALNILKNYIELKLLFHCYTSDKFIASRILDLGGLISIPGVVTFQKAENLRSAVKFIPIDRLVLETDCPFLAPHPVRGRRNEPAFLIYTAQKVAEIKNIDLETVAEKTTENAVKYFNLKI